MDRPLKFFFDPGLNAMFIFMHSHARMSILTMKHKTPGQKIKLKTVSKKLTQLKKIKKQCIMPNLLEQSNFIILMDKCSLKAFQTAIKCKNLKNLVSRIFHNDESYSFNSSIVNRSIEQVVNFLNQFASDNFTAQKMLHPSFLAPVSLPSFYILSI